MTQRRHLLLALGASLSGHAPLLRAQQRRQDCAALAC